MDHVATDQVAIRFEHIARDLAKEEVVLQWRISCRRALPERHQRRVDRLERLQPKLRHYLEAVCKRNGKAPKWKPADLVGPLHPAVLRESR